MKVNKCQITLYRFLKKQFATKIGGMNHHKNTNFVPIEGTISNEGGIQNTKQSSSATRGKDNTLSTAPLTWTAELQAHLGVMTDTAIAEQFGIPKVSVRTRRLRLGIPAAKRLSHRRTHWTKEMDHMLGCDTDAAIAKKIGVSAVTVNQRRRQLQIPSFRKKQGLSISEE